MRSDKKLLQECILQLEYLNEKFGETGTTNSLLAKLKVNTEDDDQYCQCGNCIPDRDRPGYCCHSQYYKIINF